MAKGKKFNAAEKHFEQKRIELDKKIKYLYGRIDEQNKIIVDQKEEIYSLTEENQKLHEWVDRLLEFTELSKEDIKSVCERDKKLGSLFDLMGAVSKFL